MSEQVDAWSSDWWREMWRQDTARADRYMEALAWFYVNCGDSQDLKVMEALKRAKAALGVKDGQ